MLTLPTKHPSNHSPLGIARWFVRGRSRGIRAFSLPKVVTIWGRNFDHEIDSYNQIGFAYQTYDGDFHSTTLPECTGPDAHEWGYLRCNLTWIPSVRGEFAVTYGRMPVEGNKVGATHTHTHPHARMHAHARARAHTPRAGTSASTGAPLRVGADAPTRRSQGCGGVHGDRKSASERRTHPPPAVARALHKLVH